MSLEVEGTQFKSITLNLFQPLLPTPTTRLSVKGKALEDDFERCN
ncbi:hypothetical protein SEVCU012_2087 [Staphylococcus pettenkoferi VCU012]|nr:hypothetical protein SEVCU012_2087 [Staphylococcus pettenkoferi VCU012]